MKYASWFINASAAISVLLYTGVDTAFGAIFLSICFGASNVVGYYEGRAEALQKERDRFSGYMR